MFTIWHIIFAVIAGWNLGFGTLLVSKYSTIGYVQIGSGAFMVVLLVTQFASS